MNGLFNLTNLESMNDDDIMGLNINESAEFDNKTPDVNHPEVPFETGGASGHQTTVPGVKETPSAKPHDNASISVPGGLKENPSSKPADAKSVPVPSRVTLTSDEYNSAISALKKSFKEGYEIMELLENANVINESLQDKQDAYIESVMGDQLLAAYEDGPVFEAVDRADKNDVKSLVKKLRGTMPELSKKYNVKFKPPKTFLRLLLNVSATMSSTETSKYHVADNVSWWTTRFWQVLGVVYADNVDIKTVVEGMNEDLKDQLGDYRVLYSMSFKGLYDLWNTKFGWKNRNRVYFLIVDKKLPKELKELQSDMEEALAKK